MSSWTKFWGECKSRLSGIARSCFTGRSRWRSRARKLKSALDVERQRSARSEAAAAKLEEDNLKLREENSELRVRLSEREQESRASSEGVVQLPMGTPPPGQSYPAGLMELCVNLASVVGLRRCIRVLRIVFDWLKVTQKIPCYQTVRGWMQRVGLDRMNRAKHVDDGVWFVDHTNQIGQEKALVITRVRKTELPPEGTPLRRKDMELIACIPNTEWKREDVLKAYQQTEAQYGFPVAILTDGAVELREPAKKLKNKGKSPIVLRDLKHFLANRMEKLLNSDPRYKEFTSRIGQTRSALQQTEMSHLTPPGFKTKARFMNIKPTLDWAEMAQWQLDHPDSQARVGIDPKRIEAKLGWLRSFEASIREWGQCQQVISQALTFFNANGIRRGSARAFLQTFNTPDCAGRAQQLLDEVVQFIQSSERHLKGCERLPISTEILESTLALFKELEQQHAKSGFTSLLLTLGTLLRPTTQKEMRASLSRVKIADVKAWVAENIPKTVASQRQKAYCESRASKRATVSKAAA